MRVESDGHSRGNPRLYELFENAPKEGKSPTVWAFPQFVEFLKVAGQPVQGPWPPHQRPRPDPTDEESGPVAVPDPAAETRHAPKASAPSASTHEAAPQASPVPDPQDSGPEDPASAPDPNASDRAES